jgi:hypothetical protein
MDILQRVRTRQELHGGGPDYVILRAAGDEIERYRMALNDIASGVACLPGYGAEDAAAAARQALAPRVEMPESGSNRVWFNPQKMIEAT